MEHHQTPTHPPKGKHKFYHIAHKVDDIKNKDCEHAKKPIVEIDFKWPNIKHDSNSDKVHATATNIVQGLNETLNKIGEQVEVKKAAIKQLVDKSVDNIDKTAGGVYQQIENESSKLIDRINKKLKTIEKQLERLKFGWVKSVTELEEDEDEDNEDDMTRAIDDNQSTKVNVVHSEIGKKLRSLELLDLDAELRSDLKTSISDAVRKAQDKFNKLIDDQVAKINNKISYVTEKFEDAFKKFNDALALLPRPTLRPQPTKIFTPPTYETKYTTIVWKPKSTTPIPDIPTKNKKTTPEYYKYTVPTPKYKAVEIPPSDNTLMTDLNRMDAYVETLEIVDNARDDAAKKIDEKVEEIDEAKAEVDTGKSLDDLQSQVLETVRDTLKSGDEESEDSQSEVVENPDDKLKSDADGKVVEEALTEELRNGDKLLDENVADEKSQINTQEKNSDELAKIVNEFDGDEYEATTSSQNFDDAVKSLEIDEDGGFDEMRAIEDGSGDAVVDIDEGKKWAVGFTPGKMAVHLIFSDSSYWAFNITLSFLS